MLALFVPGSAAALSQVYVLQMSSTITLTAGSPQPLTGELALSFTGFCVAPFDPSLCMLRYEFDELALIGGGKNIALGPVTPFFDQPLPFPLFGDVEITFPGAAEVDDFVLERNTLTPQLPGESLYFERRLDTPNPNPAPDAVFSNGPLPDEIFFDLDLTERELRQFSNNGVWTMPTALSSEVVASLSFHAVAVPEPASAVSLALVLGVLGACRSPRRRSSGLRVGDAPKPGPAQP